jgi:hypothetical protein
LVFIEDLLEARANARFGGDTDFLPEVVRL